MPTIRERLRSALLDGPATAQDLSKLLGIPEKEVYDHLPHLERSLKHKRESLLVEPPVCLDCGFAFRERTRLTRPGSCPECRGHHISPPGFRVVFTG